MEYSMKKNGSYVNLEECEIFEEKERKPDIF